MSERELARLGTAIRKVETESRTGACAIAAIRLLTLTGARKGEIRNLRWDEIDFEAALLRLHDSKTGPKIIRPGAAAMEILSGLERKHPEWVFPGTRGTKPIELAGTWRRVRTLAGLEDVRLHDLRHTYASAGVNGGASLQVMGAFDPPPVVVPLSMSVASSMLASEVSRGDFFQDRVV